MKLPMRLYYPLPEAAAKMGCSVNDIIHYASTGAMNISVFIDVDFKNEPDRYIGVGFSNEVKNSPGFYDDLVGKYLKDHGWIINDLEHLERAGNWNHPGYYGKSIYGFFYIGDSNIVNLEFSGDDNILIDSLFVKSSYDSNNDVLISFMGIPISVNVKYLCVMASEFNNIKEYGNFQVFAGDLDIASEKRTRVQNGSKQNKLIKALIEIAYGKGSSEKPRSLLNEERGTGDFLIDLQKMGIKPPVTGSTLADYLKDIELDYVGIPTPTVENDKK
ncbi:conserved hypothetical protein [Enterobacterales bacterium 8AC]|nr:conserved hypothetical protein [Enterobacterales bacterium 8AC]